ncbi:MAG: hypothetical protein QXO15_12120 [Nitrososphaerota archaeon]
MRLEKLVFKRLAIFALLLFFLNLVPSTMAQDYTKTYTYYPYNDIIERGKVLSGYLGDAQNLDNNYYVILEHYFWSFGDYFVYDHYFYFKIDPHGQILHITVCIYYYCESRYGIENLVMKIYDYKNEKFYELSRSSFENPRWWNITLTDRITNYISSDGVITLYIRSSDSGVKSTIYYDYIGLVISFPKSIEEELRSTIRNLEQQLLDLQKQLQSKNNTIALLNKEIVELKSRIYELERMLTLRHYIMRGDFALIISLTIITISIIISRSIVKKAKVWMYDSKPKH